MMQMFVEGDAGSISVTVEGEGPTILCVHGWPEHSCSWRHQVNYFADRGYQIAAMDVRGYGDSAKPHEISAYSLKSLASDVAAVCDALSDDPVILFGHDWGAPIVYTTALLYPDEIRAVAGMSVPHTPGGEISLLDLMRAVYADRFFYMLYFQEEGVAEAEMEADPRAALRKIYYAISGDSPENNSLGNKEAGSKLLDGLIDPDPFPAWLTPEELEIYATSFEKGGFRGAFNRYRALDLDHQELAEYRGAALSQPACFIGGEKDPVRAFVPGVDSFAMAGMACTDFRGSTVVPGVGHWVQQEAPEATNAALEAFLNTLK
jgi:pimeloyl-ACP methyl ester carboxylesterase